MDEAGPVAPVGLKKKETLLPDIIRCGRTENSPYLKWYFKFFFFFFFFFVELNYDVYEQKI